MKVEHRSVLILLAMGMLAAAPAPAQQAETGALDELCARIQRQFDTIPEADVIQALRMGRELGRPYLVDLSIKTYMSRQRQPSPALLELAIENAFAVSELRTAVTRCKAYLALAPAGDEKASNIAAMMYGAQIDFLGAGEDAYRLMGAEGRKFRASAAVRKFDSWFLGQARRRQDYTGFADRLALILADKQPLELERLYYWESLDWLLEEIKSPSDAKYGAAPHCRKIAGMIRGDPRRQHQYAFLAANLAFAAGVRGKDAAALARDFEDVLAAARAYAEKYPDAVALKQIMLAFDRGGWDMQGDAKRAFFVSAFDKLSAGDREKMMAWKEGADLMAARIATPEQWAELGARHAAMFRRSPATASVPFVTAATDPAVYAKQSEFLKGVKSRSAAVVNSLAAGPSLEACVDALVRQESWHLAAAGDVYDIINRDLWPTFQSLKREGAKPGDEVYYKAMADFCLKHLGTTPIALFDPKTAEACVMHAWRSVRAGGSKGAMASYLQAFDWVPWTQRDREYVFGAANQDFRKWAEEVRSGASPAARRKQQAAAGLQQAQDDLAKARQARLALRPDDQANIERVEKRIAELTAKAAELDAEVAAASKGAAGMDSDLAALSPLSEAFKRAMNPAIAASTQAPNELCGHLRAAMQAADARSADAFVAAARQCYALVKDPQTGHAPLARVVTGWLLGQGARMDIADFQCEVLSDMLSRWQEGGDNLLTEEAANVVMRSRRNWDWFRAPVQDQAIAVKLNAVFAKALGAQMDKGQFSDILFTWVKGTRRGEGWHDRERNGDLFLRIIKEKRLAVTALMAHANGEFQIPKEFSVETYFDDMFVEEATAKNILDAGYWDQRGKDLSRKVRNCAARIIQRYDAIPLGYGDSPVAYAPGDFWRWQQAATEAEPAVRDEMLAQIEAKYGVTRFDSFARGRTYFQLQADVSQPAGRKLFFEKLAAYLDRVAQSPERSGPPTLVQLSRIDKPDSLTDAELDVLARMFRHECAPWQWARGNYYENAITLLHQGMLARKRDRDLFASVPYLWAVARDSGNTDFHRALIGLTERLLTDGKAELAAIYSTMGHEIMAPLLADADRNALNVLRSRSLGSFGGAIPVKPSDPRYPIFASQAEFLMNNKDRAWKLYLDASIRLMDMFKELDPSYCIWVIEQETGAGRFDQAADIARTMIQWMDANPMNFNPETRLNVMLAYGNIAFSRPEYPRAKALYSQIAAAKEFEGLNGQVDAEIQIAEIDRITGQTEEAVQRLEKLLKQQTRYVQTEANFQLARIRYYQEDYDTSRELLEKVFSMAPTHTESRILEGRVNLAIKKLEDATQIRKISDQVAQQLIVPGKVLRITVEDKTLAVVGRTSDIEVRVWASSGDEEIINLRPWADSRMRFQGEIGTELAPLRKGDKTLQVLGGDQVRYDYSDAFKAAHKITESVSHVLKVVSDAELYASSGTIISREEQEKIDMENMIRAKLQLTAGSRGAGEGSGAPLSDVRVGNQVKPGNKINLRVVDKDRSRTATNDTLTVRVRTTSGDSIEAFPLSETETHSGAFNGAVPTAPAPAAAYATDSDEGSSPSFAISSGEYPAWVALPDSKRPKAFTVDLNDNKFLGSMQVVAAVPGRKLKDLVLQVSMNGKTFQTIGGWPVQFQPWNGAPTLVLVKAPAATPQAAQMTMGQLIEDTSLQQKRVIRLKNMAAKWGADVMGQSAGLGMTKEDLYVVRCSAAFYIAKHQVRTLRLDAKATDPNITYALYVDGVDVMAAGGRGAGTPGSPVVGRKGAAPPRSALPPGQEPPPVQFKGILKKGVHTVDVYISGTIETTPGFELMCDSEQPPFMVPCPAEMFDPEKNPEMGEGLRNWVAGIQPTEDGGTFNVTFSKETRGRALRLIMHDFETDAPAISKIHLKSNEGEVLLPTPVDLLALRRNQVLEIIPGDTVNVVYEDPTGVERNNQKYESSLSVTYANAVISAGLVVGYQAGPDGAQVPVLAQIYRFQTNDTIDVTVRDPDADTSEKEDTVTYTVQTFGKEPVALEAKETGPHTGVFAGRIFPVAGDPKRKSEIRVVEGDDLVLSYLDRENTEPGVPWVRSVVVEQVWYQEPEIRVYDVRSQEAGAAAAAGGGRPVARPAAPAAGKGPAEAGKPEEAIAALYELVMTRPGSATNAAPTQAVVGGPVLVELQWPTIARSSASKASVYVQTKAGRQAYGKEIPAGTFDTAVPGTIRLTSGIGAQPVMPIPLGYRSVTVTGDRDAGAQSATEVGRFSFGVPMAPGAVPKQSLANLSDEDRAALEEGVSPDVLKVRGDDELYLGFKYSDAQGAEHWITRTVRLVPGGVLFDVMDKDYAQALSAVYVGNSAYYRVVNPAADTSDERDVVKVALAATSGKQMELELSETFAHSGVFKGLVKFNYDTPGAEAEAGALPVTYGATVAAKYSPGHMAAMERTIEVFKGSDGDVMPFSKRFRDPSIAVRTQLAIAEAYFELAKEHRRLKQTQLSAFEIAEGKRILEEAVSDYPDTEARAQADFLLANLSLEYAEDATDKESKEKAYREAVVRFRDIVSTHPDSPYAPKAQYKKALTLEKLGDIDVACEEYVKLSYRWPDHELIAETIARLGQYFYSRGKAMADSAEKVTDALEKEKIMIQARDFYTTSAEVFGRLAVRFPSHKLADKTTVLSGQCYMRAEDYNKAVRSLRRVTDNLEADKNVRPEAMYWCGDSYYRLASPDNLIEAYRMWKKLTWDYPATQWAKYARGRLAEPEMAGLDREQ